MEKPLQVRFHGLDRSEAIERRIRAKAEGLERFAPDIVSCQVTVEARHKQHRQGNVYGIHLLVHLPNKEIVVGRDHPAHREHEDVYVAVRDAFDAAVRQLEDHARRRRGEVKHHEVGPANVPSERRRGARSAP